MFNLCYACTTGWKRERVEEDKERHKVTSHAHPANRATDGVLAFPPAYRLADAVSPTDEM